MLLRGCQPRGKDVRWPRVGCGCDVAARRSAESARREDLPAGGEGVAVRLYEERLESAAAGLQPLVVTEEEAAGDRRRPLVEGSRDVLFAPERCSAILREADPVIGWQVRGLARSEIASVVVGDRDGAVVEGDRWRVSRQARRQLVDDSGSCPVVAGIARGRHQDLVVPDPSAQVDLLLELRGALPDDEELSGRRVDRDFLEPITDAQSLAGVRIDDAEAVEGCDQLWSGPGVAAVGGLDEGELRVAAGPPPGGVRRQDQVGEVEEGAVLCRCGLPSIDHDDVAYRLLPFTGIDDDLRLAPGLPAVCRLGEEG